MSHHYAPLPNPGHGYSPSQHEREAEMEAAFGDSDDEDDNATESQPLNPQSQTHLTTLHSSGAYNFESADYDYPPPGSPPPPSSTALPNNIGNSNGFIPTFTPQVLDRGPHRMWFQRAAAAVLPSSISSRIGLTLKLPSGPVGGGTNNDGVFANVTAKPTAPIGVQNANDNDDPYVVPEETRQEAPPSYASAQADAVPPYWETTIHAPFAPDSIGDMVIDNLPTGSVFSFCWNLLVSVSFQFVGFLLTYLLHTSHAARLGSRAGLGVTLIQYGFALRSRLDTIDETGRGDWEWPEPDSGVHADSSSNNTWIPRSNVTQEQATVVPAGSTATTEWLSFFLMTIGWFILLTSLLGFWRVKRWEREILASRDSSSGTVPPRTIQPNSNLVSHLESSLGLHGISRIELLRQGFGLNTRNAIEGGASQPTAQTEGGERDQMLMIRTDDPGQTRTLTAALESEARLRRHLREAGFL